MAESDHDLKTVFERALLQAAAEKMRTAADLIDVRDLPSDAVVGDAGVLCADAGTLLESLYDERLAARGQVEDGEGREHGESA